MLNSNDRVNSGYCHDLKQSIAEASKPQKATKLLGRTARTKHFLNSGQDEKNKPKIRNNEEDTWAHHLCDVEGIDDDGGNEGGAGGGDGSLGEAHLGVGGRQVERRRGRSGGGRGGRGLLGGRHDSGRWDRKHKEEEQKDQLAINFKGFL